MPPTTSSLPLEILDRVCEYIALDYPEGLYDVVLVNKHWYSVAGKYRYLRIHVNVVNRQRLARDLLFWTRALERVSGFISVRELTILGRMPHIETDYRDTSYLDEWEFAGHAPEDDLTQLDRLYYQSFSDVLNRGVRHVFHGWEALADLLKRLTGLQSLVWACETPLPPSVLQVLQHDIRNCRLHYRTFKLPSLHQKSMVPHDIDAHDYALATYKHLTSVLVPLSHYDSSGCVEYNQEAVQKMAAGLAPDLTQVHVVYGPPGAGSDRVRNLRRPAWRGFFIDQEDDSGEGAPQRSSLIHLQTWSLSPANYGYFSQWEARIAFSELQVLQLWAASLETLQAVRHIQFTSLKTLALDLEYPQGSCGEFKHSEAARLDVAASEFLLEMAVSVQRIHLSGIPTCERAFKAVLQRHGSTLQTLSLVSPGSPSRAGPQMTVSRIMDIHRYCPRLRDLRVPIQRAGGNSHEVEIYKAFGVFSDLSDLFFQLDMTNGLPRSPLSVPPSHNTEAQEAIDTFINAAVDEVLVRDILAKIVAAGALSLQRFKVVVNLDVTRPEVLLELIFHMARKWKCTRFPAIIDRGVPPWHAKVVVERLGSSGKRFLQTLDHRSISAGLGKYELLFRRLWPNRTADWDNDWHSFPLS
ncbi:hypothetical protein BJY04DRAFT_178067 [Aspergillus karnatakaensis]|uniref:uncharacterized protein n=1 Tax=Aspergillus karnatakaensis TaxID=1810916 RepID=UPI003CCD3D0E